MMRTFTVKFRSPSKDELFAIRPWLPILDETLPLTGAPDDQPIPTTDGAIWLTQVLALALKLLQIRRYPVFEPLPILTCNSHSGDPSCWESEAELPDPDLVAPPAFKKILEFAFVLGSWMTKADAEKTIDRNQLFALIEDRLPSASPPLLSNGKSTFEILRAAHRLGIPFRLLPAGAFQLGWGANARYVDRSTTDRDSVMGLNWTRNKLLCSDLLRKAGLPAPQHYRALSIDEAILAAESLSYPVVVKPTDCERGEGISVDVHRPDLETCFARAITASPSKRALVEQQVDGVCHRILIASGSLLFAVKRNPIGIYGDGISTVNELINQEYDKQQRRPSWFRTKIQPLDQMALDSLRRQDLTPESVPKDGVFVDLRRIESTELGGISEDVTEVIHPDNVSLAIRAAELFRLETAGVDIMSRDITVPWWKNGAVINEVNFAPLFGTSEVSRKYLATYLSRVITGDGRIPIHAYEGDAGAVTEAIERFNQLRKLGVAAYLVNDEEVLGPDGLPYPLMADSLTARVNALLLHRRVEVVVLASRQSLDRDWLRRLRVAPGAAREAMAKS